MPPSASLSMPTWQKVAIAVLVILLLVVLGSPFATYWAYRHGTQMHPDGMVQRDYSYYELLGLRLTHTQYTPRYNSLQGKLVQNRWISQPVPNPQDSDWWTVTHFQFGKSEQTDANILVEYLTDLSRDISLEKWSTDHPRHAEVMWQEIEMAARGGFFLLIPDIVRRMTQHSTSEMQEAYFADHPAAARPTPNEASAITEERERKIARHWLEPYLVTLYQDLGTAAAEAELWNKAYFAARQLTRLAPGHPEVDPLLDRIPTEEKAAAKQQFERVTNPKLTPPKPQEKKNPAPGEADQPSAEAA
ncbi:MAG: hypothetical protein WDZ51_19675 [Pirellulaceae bacterium]